MLLTFVLKHTDEIFLRIFEHFFMVFIAISIAVAIGIPLGVILSRSKIIGEIFIYFSSVIFVVPSLALFGLMLPVLAKLGNGIGYVPAIIAVVIYSVAPIVRNTYAGINAIDPSILDAAKGMGMSMKQRIFLIELPLSLSAILVGIRISLVLGVAVICIGTYIGAGGIGLFIARGISQSDFTQVFFGAILVSVMALSLDALFTYLERLFSTERV